MNTKKFSIPEPGKNINTSERIASFLSGSYLLYNALSQKKSKVKALAAGYLIFRGATGYCPIYHSLKIDKTRPVENIRVKSYITVNKGRQEVYAFWRKLDNLPLFMKHLESVTVLDADHALWKAKIPGNLGTLDWKSEIMEEVAGEYIAWKSMEGSQVENMGVVQFKDAGKFGTEVHIELSYHAPAGAIGEGIGKLLNPVLERMIKEDIKNFRKYFETGEVPTYEGQSTGKH
jgi:uncharacterized membrane protein